MTLWEALYGIHPFGEGGTLGVIRAITRGRLRQVPRDRSLPPWLSRALARGLDLSAPRRWPDMGALLDELEHHLRRTRTRRRFGGLLTLATGVVLGASAVGYAFAERGPGPCDAAAERAAEAWGPERRSAVRAALLAADRPYAATTAERVDAALEARVREWAAMATDSCLATHVRHEQSPELLDLRSACLQDRLTEFAALTELLAREGGAVIDRAVQASAALTALDRCADAIALTSALAPPSDAELRARVEALRPRVAAAKAALDAGRLADGLQVAREAAEQAEATGHRPLIAEASYVLGLLENRSGDPRAAETSLVRAALGGLATRDDELAARAMVELIGCLGVYQARVDEAERWSDLAAAVLDRISPRGQVVEAKRLSHAGIVASIRGDLGGARDLHERAVALLDRPTPPDLPALVGALSNLGNTLADLGRHEEAVAEHRRAAQLATELYGPEHPQLATLLSNLGATLADLGHDEEAAELHVRALMVKERTLGPEHVSVAASLTNLAQVRARQGQLALAEALLRRALPIRERTLGPEHPEVAELLIHLAEVVRRRGRRDEALDLATRAVAISEARDVSPAAGVFALAELGEVLRESGRVDEAEAALRRALALEPGPAPPSRPAVSAALRLSLADVLWDRPAARAEARALVERARDFLAPTGAGFAEARARVESWLSSHPAP